MLETHDHIGVWSHFAFSHLTSIPFLKFRNFKSSIYLHFLGYLINQFISTRTNKRKDKWGGSYENRIQFPVEIVRRVREAVGPKFIIIYRLSMLDLVPEGKPSKTLLCCFCFCETYFDVFHKY